MEGRSSCGGWLLCGEGKGDPVDVVSGEIIDGGARMVG